MTKFTPRCPCSGQIDFQMIPVQNRSLQHENTVVGTCRNCGAEFITLPTLVCSAPGQSTPRADIGSVGTWQPIQEVIE